MLLLLLLLLLQLLLRLLLWLLLLLLQEHGNPDSWFSSANGEPSQEAFGARTRESPSL